MNRKKLVSIELGAGHFLSLISSADGGMFAVSNHKQEPHCDADFLSYTTDISSPQLFAYREGATALVAGQGLGISYGGRQ